MPIKIIAGIRNEQDKDQSKTVFISQMRYKNWKPTSQQKPKNKTNFFDIQNLVAKTEK